MVECAAIEATSVNIPMTILVPIQYVSLVKKLVQKHNGNVLGLSFVMDNAEFVAQVPIENKQSFEAMISEDTRGLAVVAPHNSHHVN